MKVLVVAATELEIATFKQNNIYEDVLITGMGIASTVYSLTKKLQSSKYDLVIQAGIAGTYTKEIIPGEVVLVQKDTFGDLGIIENESFNTLFDLRLANADEFPFHGGWLENSHQILGMSKLIKVTGVTIQTISEDANQKNRLIQKFGAGVESMEGAAFHYVCLLEETPFIQIRSISNEVGIRDKNKWLMKESIGNLNSELQILIDSIKKV